MTDLSADHKALANYRPTNKESLRDRRQPVRWT